MVWWWNQTLHPLPYTNLIDVNLCFFLSSVNLLVFILFITGSYRPLDMCGQDATSSTPSAAVAPQIRPREHATVEHLMHVPLENFLQTLETAAPTPGPGKLCNIKYINFTMFFNPCYIMLFQKLQKFQTVQFRMYMIMNYKRDICLLHSSLLISINLSRAKNSLN